MTLLRRGLSVFVAVLMVSSVVAPVAGGPVGVAAAQEDDEEVTCGEGVVSDGKKVIGDVGSGLANTLNPFRDTGTVFTPCDSIAEGTTVNASVAETKQQARSIKRQIEQDNTALRTQLARAETAAKALARSKAIEAYQQGKSRSEAITDAEDAVDKYYSEIQLQYINRIDSQASEIKQLSDRTGEVRLYVDSATKVPNPDAKSITLIDGSNVDVAEYVNENADGITPSTGNDETDYADRRPGRFYVVSGEGTRLRIMDAATQEGVWNSIQSSYNNIGPFVDSIAGPTYDDLEAGNVSNPTTSRDVYVNINNSDREDYINDLGELISTGYNAPNVTETRNIEVTIGDNNTLSGALATPEFTGQLNASQTYYPNDFQGSPVLIPDPQTANKTGSDNPYVLNNEFTISQISGPNGGSLNSTNVTESPALEDDVEKLTKEVEQLQKDIESFEPDGGGGGGGGDGGDGSCSGYLCGVPNPVSGIGGALGNAFGAVTGLFRGIPEIIRSLAPIYIAGAAMAAIIVVVYIFDDD